MTKPPPGAIAWVDLTVKDANRARDFYQNVVGWSVEEHSMGDYSDYVMRGGPENNGVAGICHAQGLNADLPPVWLIYVTVEDIEASCQRCSELGGTVLSAPRSVGGYGRMAVIQDPSGAALALMQPPSESES